MSVRFSFAARALIGLYPLERGQTRVLNAMGLERFIPNGSLAEGPFGLRFRVKPEKRFAYLWYWGACEPKLLRPFVALLSPGMTVLDVGSNFGWYTALFSHLVGPTGRVHAFEPLPAAFAETTETVELNRLSQATVHNVAVSDSPGNLVFSLDPKRSEIASALEGATGTERVECRTTTLDHFIAESGLEEVHLVKVDVEGLELEVLRGADELLRNQGPVLSLEFAGYLLRSRGLAPDVILSFLKERGYTRFLKVAPGCRPTELSTLGGLDHHCDVLAFTAKQEHLHSAVASLPRSRLRGSRRRLRSPMTR